MRLFARLAVAFVLVAGLAGQLRAQLPTPESLIAAIRQRLGAPPGPPTEAADQARQIKDILAAGGANPSAALARIREVVGAPTAPPSPGDAQELSFIGQMVAAVELPVAPPTARLADAPQSHPNPNVLERSHMFFGLHGLLFEAQIAPHIFFYDSLDRLYEGKPEERPWAFAWSFTPMLRVRNRSDTSGPIKTLSWMPKTDFQVVRRSPIVEDPGRGFSTSTLTLHATVGHHSNGQDECTYVPGVLSREDLCPAPTRREDVKINYPNGSFSTNYVKIGAVKRWVGLKRYRDRHAPDEEQLVVHSSFSAGLYLEANPSGLKVGGVLDPVLRPLYGTNRIHGTVELEHRVGPVEGKSPWRGSVRATGWASYIDKIPAGVEATFTSEPDAPLNELYTPNDGSSRFRFGVEAAYNPDWLRGWGFEVRYQHGQDYYNLLFVRDIHWFQMGIVWDAAEFEPFKLLRHPSR